jgi:hypothetical protein
MPHNPKVAGSNPAPATTSILLILLKKFTRNQRRRGFRIAGAQSKLSCNDAAIGVRKFVVGDSPSFNREGLSHGRPFLLLFREPHREHGRRQFFGLVLLAYIGLALIEVHELRCVVAAHQALGVDRDRALALVAERGIGLSPERRREAVQAV